MRRTLEICSSEGVELEIRTTCLGVLSEEEIFKIADEIEEFSPNFYVLQEYFPPPWAPPEFSQKIPPEEIKRIAEEISKDHSYKVAYRILGESGEL